MGERALGLCRRPDGRYDCYYSQWAASPDRLYPVLRGGGPEPLLDGCDWEWRGTNTLDDIVATLDYLTIDAVYVLSPSAIRVVLPVWLGLDLGVDRAPDPSPDVDPVPGPDPSFGALVRVDTVAEAVHLRTGIRRLKARLGKDVEAGAVSPGSAIESLLLFLSPFRYRLSPAVRAVIHPDVI